MIFSRKILLLIIIFYSLFFLKVKAQDYVLNYEQFTTKQGLANNFVNCIAEDKKGFIWLGTQDGLCRYDGHSYKTYKTDIEKKHILLSNNITSLAIFNDSLLYVGTEAGLHILNTYQNSITPIKGFENKYISQILIDSEKTIWVVNQSEGVFIRKKTHTNWQRLTDVSTKFEKRLHIYITEKKVNGQSKIFMSKQIIERYGSNGLYEFEKGKWKPIFFESNMYLNTFHKGNLLVTKGVLTHDQKLDTAYKDKNLCVKYITRKNKQDNRLNVNFNSKIYENYLYVPLNTSVLVVDMNTYQVVKEIKIPAQNSAIKDIYIDTSGNLWVATSGSGLFIFPTYSLYSIRGYRFHVDNDSKGLSKTSVRAIYKDDKTTWIGTYSEKRIVDIFWKDSIKKNLPIQSYAFVIKEDKKDKNRLWVATNNDILKVAKYPSKVLKYYAVESPPRALEVISDSIILFADFEYIYTFNTQKAKIKKKTPINKTTYLYQGSANIVWIGTETDGFSSWDLQTDKITYYNPEKNSIVKNLHVKCIYEDTKGLFWIATTRGLYSFNKNTKQVQKFDIKNGLPNNVVYAILEDQNYNLWLSTNHGISKFNIKKETFENFDVNDGLQDNEYNTHSFHKSREGELFFGGINGVDAFFPNDLKRNKYAPNLVLTIFKKLGKEVQTAIPIEKMEKLVLPVDSAQMLTFEFAALSFYQNKRNQYAYKIEEIDTTWVQLGNKNELTLTNLAAGNYTLRIKASNNHGVWNEEGITIKINIVPPVWQQNWFLITLLLFFLVGLYMLYKVRIYQLRRREEELEAQIKERTRELATANRNKDQLFAIIAHDLRSPLTAFEDISNQIEYFLRKNKPQRLIELGNHIDTSIQGLNILLNNLLGWALIQQNHQIQTDTQVHDLSEIVERIVAIYQNVAQSNQIELKNLVQENIEIVVDLDSFQTILRNLVSNALKYTPHNGTVELSVCHKQDIENQNIVLAIKDTGIGMSQEMIKTVFDPTNMQTNRGIRGEKGTGLGLALCQEFAQINNIKIEVESEPNQGTIFYLIIPTP